MPTTSPITRWSRRHTLLAGAALLSGSARAADAAWPGGPVVIHTPYGAGGTSHNLSGVVAAQMSISLGNEVSVQARPDQTLTSMISAATGAKFTYIPFKSGSEAGVQLAGKHIDSNVNNPSENIGQWKAGMVRPLCIFSAERMAAGPKITKDMAWSDIPTCKESGLPIESYQMPRSVWLPAGVSADAVKFYTQMLDKVRQTPEWKAYIERTSQTDRFLTGDEWKAYVKNDAQRAAEVFKREGWLAQ